MDIYLLFQHNSENLLSAYYVWMQSAPPRVHVLEGWLSVWVMLEIAIDL
jgi:hypothetical protein